MKNKLRWFGFGAGFILLLLLFQFQFNNDSSWKSWNLPLTGKVIYIDPGHGGPDGGAVGTEHLEKDIALAISKQIRDYLQEQGHSSFSHEKEIQTLRIRVRRAIQKEKVRT